MSIGGPGHGGGVVVAEIEPVPDVVGPVGPFETGLPPGPVTGLPPGPVTGLPPGPVGPFVTGLPPGPVTGLPPGPVTGLPPGPVGPPLPKVVCPPEEPGLVVGPTAVVDVEPLLFEPGTKTTSSIVNATAATMERPKMKAHHDDGQQNQSSTPLRFCCGSDITYCLGLKASCP